MTLERDFYPLNLPASCRLPVLTSPQPTESLVLLKGRIAPEARLAAATNVNVLRIIFLLLFSFFAGFQPNCRLWGLAAVSCGRGGAVDYRVAC